MDNLEYSIDALNAKGLFYNKELTVYVEGKEDILFWKYLFDLAEVSAYIEDVGGDKEIEKYIENILNDDASFTVACDSDHKPFMENHQIHPRIITTYGYSIENSMYNVSVINDMVCKIGRISIDLKEAIEIWAIQFTNDVFDLLKYDIANHKFNKGISILGENCIRFLVSPTSHLISKNKVNEFLKSVEGAFTKKEIAEVEQLISESKKEHWFLIKGHFLTHATINIVRYLVNRISGVVPGSISHDMIYSLTINVTENWREKIDIVTIIEEVKKLKT
jgi:hypothetical protein